MNSNASSTAARSTYIGRFAPSPTGPLHQGSLLTAVASYLDARAVQGKWLMRMEDLDPPREQLGAADDILRCLEIHGLEWDGEVMWQSQRHEAYQEALQQLKDSGHTFLCDCTRSRLKTLNGAYDGHCRDLALCAEHAAIRLKVSSGLYSFNDKLQGFQQQDLASDVGDFVIHRKDGLFAYQLAVVVDDIAQGITHVIRGCDLLDSTPRQLLIFDLLKHPRPTFGHVPIIVNREGQKLSKQTFAPALEAHRANTAISEVLVALGLPLPKELFREHCSTQLQWALTHWESHQLNAGQQIEQSQLETAPRVK